MKNIFLYNYKFTFFRNKLNTYLYIYNERYFLLIKFSKKSNLSIKNTNTVAINNAYADLFVKMDNFLKQFHKSEYKKIKFTGKGYKIKKNTNKSIILLFNRAHITTIWWRNVNILKLKKYKMYVKYTKYNKEIVDKILGVRIVNIFTKKGLRLARQILYKKKGKK